MFKKGQSGNPGGRAKHPESIAKAILRETNGGAELWEYALTVWRDDTQQVSRRDSMHGWLADRAFGKAPQEIRIDDARAASSDEPISDEQLARLEAEIALLEDAVNGVRASDGSSAVH